MVPFGFIFKVSIVYVVLNVGYSKNPATVDSSYIAPSTSILQ